MFKRLTLGLVFLTVLVISSVASGDPLTYDEAISGDLAAFPASPALIFDLGVNTVSGTFFNRPEGLDELFDFDSFRFTIPTGMSLTGIEYAFSTTGTGTLALANYHLDYAPADGLKPRASASIDLFGSSPVSPFGDQNLISGTYDVAAQGFVRSDNGQWAANYTWTLTVDTAPIPEPASLSLLALGLVGLGVRRWRQRKA